MRCVVFVRATRESEAGAMPDEQVLNEMGKFNSELQKAGVLLAGEGLHPTSKAKRVKLSGGTATVVDGPFTESKELIGGYWMLQVESLDEAVEWMKRVPVPDLEVEIRPVFEPDDFAYAPGVPEREAALRAKLT